MRLDRNDAIIAYDVARTDSAQPPVLFLHGALGVRGHFDAVRQCLSDRSHLAVDFAGHGESIARRSSMNSELLADDTLAVMDALDIPQVDIIGHSLGGYVGLVLASRAPSRVRSVTTLGTKFYWTGAAIEGTLKDLNAELMRTHAQRQYDALGALHGATGIDRTLGLMETLISDFGRWQLEEAAVRQITVPLLLTAGDHDGFVPPSEVTRLFDALEKKRNAMAILPHTPHALHHLPTRCFEQAVRRFWDRSFA